MAHASEDDVSTSPGWFRWILEGHVRIPVLFHRTASHGPYQILPRRFQISKNTSHGATSRSINWMLHTVEDTRWALSLTERLDIWANWCCLVIVATTRPPHYSRGNTSTTWFFFCFRRICWCRVQVRQQGWWRVEELCLSLPQSRSTSLTRRGMLSPGSLNQASAAQLSRADQRRCLLMVIATSGLATLMATEHPNKCTNSIWGSEWEYALSSVSRLKHEMGNQTCENSFHFHYRHCFSDAGMWPGDEW